MAIDDALPRLLLTAPASGGGKTTVTMGLLHCLAGRGLRPAAFKCGPDYIDPMFHREVLGIPGRNLDLFFTGPDTVRGLLRRGATESGVAVLEGVMGYYDGIGDGGEASSWRVAVETGTPAILIVRPRGAFLSVAALVKGFADFRSDSMIRGVLFNQCGEGLYAKLAPMLERETGLRAYGYLPDLPEAALESRHLGLVTPDGVAELKGKIDILSTRIEQCVDIGGLIELARSAPPLRAELPAFTPRAGTPVDIAVARDEAFCFYYEENLELLRDLGARLVFFSPLRAAHLPDGIAGLYLGGGYPELYADRLAENRSMLESVKRAVESGLPTVAECGGFLYLQEKLVDRNGRAQRMAGVLKGTGRDAGRLVRFGYLEMEGMSDTLAGPRGNRIRAHEFHRWDVDINADDEGAFTARKPSGKAEWRFGVGTPTLYAGFPHLYFWSDPAVAERFVAAAVQRSEQ